jgi:hypothetical protein
MNSWERTSPLLPLLGAGRLRPGASLKLRPGPSRRKRIPVVGIPEYGLAQITEVCHEASMPDAVE